MSYNPLPPLGQQNMDASLPVVIALNQNPIAVTTLGTQLSTFHLVTPAGTNATVINSGLPTIVHGWYIYNNAATARKITFYNQTSAPTAGSTTNLLMALVIPASSGANVSFPSGISFTTGLAITTVQGIADTDGTGVLLNDLNINIYYR